MSDLDKGRLVAEKLGLRHYPLTGAYDEREIHKLLADAVEVFGYPNIGWDCDEHKEDTHSAFLIGIKPLAQKDEATRLLRELVKLDSYHTLASDVRKLADRAQAYLARKGQT